MPRGRLQGHVHEDHITVQTDEGSAAADPGSPLILRACDGYAPGLVTFSDAKLTRLLGRDQEQLYTTFEGKITPDTNLTEVLLVVVAFGYRAYEDYGNAYGSDHPFVFTVMPAELGNLTAGKTRKIGLTFHALRIPTDEMALWTVVVFVRGRQVRSVGFSDMLPWFFDAQTRYGHQRLLAEREKGGDAPPAVFRSLPLNLPPELKAKYTGRTLAVVLDINRHAHIAGIQIPEIDDPILREFLLHQMAETWLSLPLVHNGELQDQTVQLKLDF